MYRTLKPLIFQLDPERAHHLILNLLRTGGNIQPVRRLLRANFFPRQSQPVTLAGLTFPNPVGLAAGYDKDCTAWRGLSCLGFGHIELGTVTPRPQPGNPRPRIFRYPDQEAVINRMGFPGRGAEYARQRIPSRGTSPVRDQIVLGINIGKNKGTPNAQAGEDYLTCLRLFHDRVDYFAINVSSPNTLGLRELQGKAYLSGLLSELIKERDRLQSERSGPLPLFVKVAPDLSDRELDEALEAISAAGVDGVIATNTTIQRKNLLPEDPGQGGGLSGKPLRDLSTAMINKIHLRTQGELPIIGVGGIGSVTDAQEKLQAGASLVQVYTGMIFKGPGLIRELVEQL